MIMSGGRRINKLYDNVAPALIIPDHFFCNQSSTIVAVYNEPLGEEVDGVTLMFPGDMPSSSPKRVVPRRVGSQTLIFDTPVYSASRGMVQVLPLLNLPQGEVELTPFQISVKHPVRNVMELCLNLSSNDAVLPVLIALMVHCERQNGREQFQRLNKLLLKTQTMNYLIFECPKSDAECERQATETAEQRDTPLERLRAVQQERLGADTAEETDTQLEGLRAAQQERLAAETVEKRDTRLEGDRNKARVTSSDNDLSSLAVDVESQMARFSAIYDLERVSLISCTNVLDLGTETAVAVTREDPHIDRIMATLVGSRLPGASTNIRDILLPERKWRRMTLEDLGRQFRLREMEKQAYVLKTQRLRWVKRRSRAISTSTSSKNGGKHDYENMDGPGEEHLSSSASSPTIHQLALGGDSSDDVKELLKQEHTLCTAVEDYDNRSDPQQLAFKAGQIVHVLRKSADGWWYGVSDDKKGMFPGRCVKCIRKVPAMRRRVSSELPDSRTDSLRRNYRRGSVDSMDRPGGQPITVDELRTPPRATYANVGISQFDHPILTSASDSESAISDSGQMEIPPTISERIRKIHGFPLLPPTKPLGWQIGSSMHLSESTGTGLDRIEVQPSAEPLELLKKSQLPLPRQGPTLSSSPLTKAHIHAPRNVRGHHHIEVDDDTSSNSVFEEDEEQDIKQDIKRRPEGRASPQTKVPLLPPSRPPMGTSRHAQPPQVPQKPKQRPAPPQTQKKPSPVPRPRRKPTEHTKADPHFETPAYEDATSSRPSPNRPLLEQHSATTTHFDVVGEHMYDLPDHLPPRDVPRRKFVSPGGPKPRWTNSDSDTTSSCSDESQSQQTGGEFLGAHPQCRGRPGSGKQVHFAAIPGATENDPSDQGRHGNFLRTHM